MRVTEGLLVAEGKNMLLVILGSLVNHEIHHLFNWHKNKLYTFPLYIHDNNKRITLLLLPVIMQILVNN